MTVAYRMVYLLASFKYDMVKSRVQNLLNEEDLIAVETVS